MEFEVEPEVGVEVMVIVDGEWMSDEADEQSHEVHELCFPKSMQIRHQTTHAIDESIFLLNQL